MLKPLLLIVGAVVVVGALMLGGWALTSVTPDVPSKPAPATGADAEAKRDAAGGGAAGPGSIQRQAPQAGQGAPASEQALAEAIRKHAAKARNARAQGGRDGPDGASDSEDVGRSGTADAQRLRAEQAEERGHADAEQARQAEERRQADAAKHRAEQVRRAHAAKQAEAARQAAADQLADDLAPDEQHSDHGPEEE